jgi:starch phosphorylase
MTAKKNTTNGNSRGQGQVRILLSDIQRYIVSMFGNDYRPPRRDTYYNGLAGCVRERMIIRWLESQRRYYDDRAKRVYYLSMEFLPGPFLKSYILSLDMERECSEALQGSGFTLGELEEEENDPGLGNGGLGRLASCYLDSMATLNIPGYGYGIRYDYGIFQQRIVNGHQVEVCDNWLRKGNLWEIARRNFLYNVRMFGRSETYVDEQGRTRYRWVDTDTVSAMACDILIPGYGADIVNNMRLWSAVSSTDFNLEYYNTGDYLKALEETVLKENISKVLYPSDEAVEGRILRLKQQYFFVAATFQDIMRRVRKICSSMSEIPDIIAVQLNDTHPSISIPELMRILLDEERLSWEDAWDICIGTFAYTNHTVLPEAMEKWPVDQLQRLLPRHMEIIFEINRRFLEEVERQCPGDDALLSRMSIIEEGPVKKIRMAHLSIVGSHAVNGVADLHTGILRERLFRDFDRLYPGRFLNITNGITQRRWLLQANTPLVRLITSVIGYAWTRDLYELKKLIPCADDPAFRESWREVRQQNKRILAGYILRETGTAVDEESLFDVQVKRIHEYKRQILNILHVITLFNRIKANPDAAPVSRTVIFAGKAAPSYRLAKLTIKLINDVAATVNSDPQVNGRLKVIFLPNYGVSQAEKIIAAADLSQHISTAGLEASGTGNMKFALNGALTIGTLDGANIEIMEEVGAENMFIFGMKSDEVERRRDEGYDPRECCLNDPELRRVMEMIASGFFSPGEPYLYQPLVKSLLDHGDRYFVLADYRSYLEAQEQVDLAFRNTGEWTRKSILTTANMGKFSSDRAVREYAERIWHVESVRAQSTGTERE